MLISFGFPKLVRFATSPKKSDRQRQSVPRLRSAHMGGPSFLAYHNSPVLARREDTSVVSTRVVRFSVPAKERGDEQGNVGTGPQHGEVCRWYQGPR
jgi:hypothetical protein